MKKNITSIETEIIHDATTHRKRLLTVGDAKPGNVATMNYAWLAPGKQLTPHAHTDGEEFYYFLDGNGQMLQENEWLPVTQGDFVTVPVESVHSVKNTGTTNLIFITVRTQS
jgi:mannose-6-phosphate isomerase-like protein (cupin superfamily)